jgi:hypothetical protein
MVLGFNMSRGPIAVMGEWSTGHLRPPGKKINFDPHSARFLEAGGVGVENGENKGDEK